MGGGADESQVPVHHTPPPFEDSGALLEEGGTQAIPTTVLHAYIHMYTTVSGTIYNGRGEAVLQLGELQSGAPGLQEDLLDCRLMPLCNLCSNAIEESW